MAATKTKKHSVIIGNKEYFLPKELEVNAYLHYLEVREDIMNQEKRTGLYTAKQFRNMMDCIVDLYNNQFTVEELTDRETGLGVASIVMEFAAIEIGVGESVNNKVETFRENFTNGK